jgi:hypothetical protein
LQSDILFKNGYPALEDTELPKHVRTVALWHLEARELEKAEKMTKFLRNYPKCQKVIFVWSGVLMEPYGDVKFYRIQDNESVVYSTKRWGAIKAHINSSWNKKSFLRNCKITKSQLPIIEAVECMFVKEHEP